MRLLLAAAFAAFPCLAFGGVAFDADGDCDVDLTDFANFQLCFTGPGGAATPACTAVHDSDGDGDVDLTDFNNFQLAFTGPGTGLCNPDQSELAGHELPNFPFFEYDISINEDDAIQVGIDPSKFPALVGTSVDIYVIDSDTAGGGLNDITPGGAMTVSIVATGVQDNTFTVANGGDLDGDVGADLGRPLDIVIDTNQNGVFDATDIIDGPCSSCDSSNAGFYLTEDTGAFGPMFFTSFEFDDFGVFPVVGPFDGGGSSNMRSRGRAVHPNPLPAGQSPLVMFSHGNTGITTSWQGYTYIQNLLASYGYVSASLDMFPAHISTGIRWRATLSNYSTDRMIRQQPTYPIMGGGILNGRVDGSRVLTSGHSRGGEGVEVQLNQVRAPSIPQILPPNINPPVTWAGFNYNSFKGVNPIAQVTFLSTQNWQTLAGTADCRKPTYLLYYGAADSDVCGCSSSVLPYTHFEGARTEKANVSLYGVGHGYYNSVWACVCTGSPGIFQRPMVEASSRSYFLPWTLMSDQDNVAARDYFTRSPETFRPMSTDIIPPDIGGTLARQVTQFVPSKEGSCVADTGFIIDDYEVLPINPMMSTSGGAVSFNVTNLLETLLADSSPAGGWAAAEPAGGFTGNGFGVVFDWSGAGPLNYTEAIIPSERDFSDDVYLSFRAGQQSGHPNTEGVNYGDKFFTVELQDGFGNTSRIRTDNYGPLDAPYTRQGGWHTQWRTYRIRLADFATNGTNIDLSDIRFVRFLFGTSGNLSSPVGRMGLDDIQIISIK